MKEHFIKAIENLKQMVSEQAAAVEHTLELSINAVNTHDVQAAMEVVDGDSAIDEFEIKIEEECLKILALYQPVASDLRQVVTVLKVNNEIERTGDLAVNIAERVVDMSKYESVKIEHFDFSNMVSIALDMLKKSLDAMAYCDVIVAAEAIRLDDSLDQLHRDNYGRVQSMILKYPQQAGYYMDCLTISRCLERVGDIATNICEDVIYQVHGRIVRHLHSN